MDNLPSLTDTIRLHGLTANKKLGQHFLLDQNITDKIARFAHPYDDVTIAEIGPGPGGLTRSLIKAGAKSIVAIEMDDRFLPILQDIDDNTETYLKVLKADALGINIPDHASGEIKIVANLPYNVGTKLLINWLTATPLFWSLSVLMFQKEVAERVVAVPGDKAYGRLAILSQSICECDLAFIVPAKAFSPPPKVDSAIVVLDPKPIDQRYPNIARLGELTRAAFGQRRKMLRKSLKPFATKYDLTLDSWLETCGIDPTRRPETLSVGEFQTLTDFSLRQ